MTNDQTSSDALVELGTASVETQGSIPGVGELAGRLQQTGLTDL